MMYEQGFSITEIARTINKNKSVVSREIKRNSDEKGRYRFTYAQEMADMHKERICQHKELAKALKTAVFFAHLYASWEKGAIENTNKLYRQYIPKGASFADYTEQEIKQIQYLLNDRPRKKINYQSPK